jgi:uncharacterized membrane protein (UPF0127 family)
MVALANGDGRVVCARCTVADSVVRRAKGLLGRTGLRPDEGLLLRPANSVHTAFMRFPIDLVFLDRELNVLDVRASVPPWRLAGRRGARAVLEMGAGEASRRGIAVSDKLRLQEPESEIGVRQPAGRMSLQTRENFQ